MVAFTYRMPAGIPGSVTRAEHAKVEAQVLNGSLPFAAYGMFGKIVSGAFVPVASGDAASVVVGILVRPYPTNSGQDGLGAAVPATTGVASVLRSGYCNAYLKLGTAAKRTQVHVVVTAGGTVVVGDLVTTTAPAGGGTAVAVPGAYFTGAADANGNVEIEYNL